MSSNTKARILLARMRDLEAQATEIRSELQSMAKAPLNVPCAGCGKMLATEYEFADHFVITDERYLNLGYCPKVGPRADV